MTVSICIPVYNVEKYISRCLESVVCQTYKDIEIIVVNDGTSDKSMEIVNKYVKKYNNFRIIEHQHNMGLMMARKTGYQNASGDYIMFLDSDDWLPADAVATLVSSQIVHNADIVSGEFVYTNGDTLNKTSSFSLKYGYDKDAVYKSLLLNEYGHQLWGKLYKTDLFKFKDLITYKDTTNGEDGILFYQILNHINKVVHINKPIYFYYNNPESSSRTKLSKKALSSIIKLNLIRLRTCTYNEELEILSKRYVTKVMTDLIMQGYHKDLITLLEENNISKFIQYRYYSRYMSKRESILCEIKKLLGHFK